MKIDSDKVLFLLGGYDLEMQTIKEALIDEGFTEGKEFFDNALQWDTAKLTAYEEVISANTVKTIYAIELEEDRTLPENYHRIDHHNDYANRDASLLQILSLLGKKPTEKQKLIAANDARYIPGMKCLSCDDNKILKIRELDRRTQNIPLEHDKIGKDDVSNRDVTNEIDVVHAHTVHFATITDSLYFDVEEKKRKAKTIIFNDTKIVFYGFQISNMKDMFEEQKIEKTQYYWGGGSCGFIGIKEDTLNKEKIQSLKNKCIANNKEKKSDIYSYHTFMLPFRFDKILDNKIFDNTYEYYQATNIDERVKIDAVFKKMLEGEGWKHKPFKINSNFDYNEYAYFYSFIRDTLYNKSEFKEGDTSYFFEKEHKGGQYNIQIKDRTYELELEGLSLRIFETGIAIFSIEVSNRKFSQSKIDDILKINEYGRRIYAPFLGKWDTHANWTQSPKDSQLPKSVEVILPDGTICDDDFCQEYVDIPNDIKISKYILKLLGENTFTTVSNQKDQYLIQPVIDDRMFVLSWYGSDACSGELTNYRYKDNSKWYEYVFIDGDGSTIHSPEMQKELITNVTYDRWMNYKDGLTLFGLSRYSFVCLTNGASFNRDVLSLPHMKTMYFQMFTLLLATRASTLRFSEEVTALSDLKNKTKDDFPEKVSELYKYYIRFVNKIYFREVTAQEQGIELFNKASELMRIERDVKDLDAEIAELHTYVSMKAEEEQSRQAEKREERLETISKLGAIFLPPSLIAGIYGMNVFDFSQSYISFTVVLLMMLISAIGSYKLISTNDKEKVSDENKENKKIEKILFSVMFAIIVFIVIFGTKEHTVVDVKVTNPVTVKRSVIKEKEIIKKEEKNENSQTKSK